MILKPLVTGSLTHRNKLYLLNNLKINICKYVYREEIYYFVLIPLNQPILFWNVRVVILEANFSKIWVQWMNKPISSQKQIYANEHMCYTGMHTTSWHAFTPSTYSRNHPTFIVTCFIPRILLWQKYMKLNT